MNTESYVAIAQLCRHYNIEQAFLLNLNEFGLLEITTIEQDQYVHEDKISDVERMIRMHYDLAINLEGIDTVLNLLEKMDDLQSQLASTQNRLLLYESL